MTEIGLVAKNHSAGEDLGKGFEQCPLLFSSSPTQLEVEQIHTAMQKSPIIRNLRFDVFCSVAATTELVEVETVEPFEILWLEDDIDTAALIFHGDKVTCRHSPGWDRD